MIRIGLIGDHDEAVRAHQAIPPALRLAAGSLSVPVEPEWVPTDEIRDDARLSGFHGLWCVPASPYRSMDGALRAIRAARLGELPFLGTCGGFQHAVIEYARSVLAWPDADHAETAPGAIRAVIAPLECALVEASGAIRFTPGSKLAAAYGGEEAVEEYRCRYGMSPVFRAELTSGPLRVAAVDHDGDVRAVELDHHPFFVATLFQPERAALRGRVPPIVAAFVRACAALVAERGRAG
jgi:CTP synthase (UTP-ammonia lyase)